MTKSGKDLDQRKKKDSRKNKEYWVAYINKYAKPPPTKKGTQAKMSKLRKEDSSYAPTLFSFIVYTVALRCIKYHVFYARHLSNTIQLARAIISCNLLARTVHIKTGVSNTPTSAYNMTQQAESSSSHNISRTKKTYSIWKYMERKVSWSWSTQQISPIWWSLWQNPHNKSWYEKRRAQSNWYFL